MHRKQVQARILAPNVDRHSHKGFTISEPAFKRRFFANVVTIDPSLVDESWARLCVDSQAVEYRELPARLHEGLVTALAGSKKLGKLLVKR